MARLHSFFKGAPVLGSLINPRAQGGNLIEADFRELAPPLFSSLVQTENQKANFENDAVELAVIAQGLTKAAELLAGQFTLVATNVPYLGRPKQEAILLDFCEHVHPEAKADLATCFVERCLNFCAPSGSTALVTPQNWLFLGSYKRLREKLLKLVSWNIVGRLGPKAFQTPMWDFNICLLTLTREESMREHQIAGFDASAEATPEERV
jgi:type I restriction-modification system DNA methylase subunit